jgi:PAS domain S-box-containing protein
VHEQLAKDLLNDESRQFALLVNSVTDCAIYMLDVDGTIRTWNPGGQRIKGYDAAEVVGTSFARFYLPDDIQAGVPARNLHTAAVEGRYLGEGWRVRRDGTCFRANVVIDPIRVDGELIGFAKVTRDVTERHAAQERLQEIQANLLQAQKLEAIGKLTLGLSHDFNNLLTVVVNCLDLISLQVTDASTRRLIDTATGAAERGTLLTRQLLTFGRGQTLSPEPVCLNTALQACETMLRRSAGEAVAVDFSFAPDLPECFVDRAQLEAAVLNLVCNSRDAMPEGGQLRLHTHVQYTQHPAQPQLPASPYACVCVKDNGEGIPLEQQARVFEPFFTTKAVGKGSGLGLSQVFGFTAQSGGFTQLISEPDHGTSVTLCFPVM